MLARATHSPVRAGRRGFKKSDYARLHPPVPSVARCWCRSRTSCERAIRNAVITDYTQREGCLLAMTKAKSGTISVVNKLGKVAGVFTDGDFRAISRVTPKCSRCRYER